MVLYHFVALAVAIVTGVATPVAVIAMVVD